MPSAIVAYVSLSGSIKSNGTLHGSIKSNGTLHGSLHILDDYEDYVGEYEITPKTTFQVIETADKRMSSDLIVKAIPCVETDNSAGGKTVIIAGGVI